MEQMISSLITMCSESAEYTHNMNEALCASRILCELAQHDGDVLCEYSSLFEELLHHSSLRSMLNGERVVVHRYCYVLARMCHFKQSMTNSLLIFIQKKLYDLDANSQCLGTLPSFFRVNCIPSSIISNASSSNAIHGEGFSFIIDVDSSIVWILRNFFGSNAVYFGVVVVLKVSKQRCCVDCWRESTYSFAGFEERSCGEVAQSFDATDGIDWSQ